MTTWTNCPECGAVWQDGQRCEDHFHQMLAWDYADAAGAGATHHLVVLCFNIQHPSRYSPEGLRGAIELLDEFVTQGTSPATMRRRMRDAVDSGQRDWRITGTDAAYDRKIPWTLRAADVTQGSLDGYTDRVRAWAESVCRALRAAGLIPQTGPA